LPTNSLKNPNVPTVDQFFTNLIVTFIASNTFNPLR